VAHVEPIVNEQLGLPQGAGHALERHLKTRAESPETEVTEKESGRLKGILTGKM
jgi:hypothetical protein